MTRTFAIPRKAFLGFDHIFDELERISTHANDSYPPHNVVKLEEHKYIVELAVAGFARDDLNIEVKDHVLTIKGNRERRRPEEQYVHRGISTRTFMKSFKLSEYTEVTGADLNDGILAITLEVKVPQEQLPKLIQISG